MNTIWRKLSADAGEGGSREATNGVGDASKLHIGISMGLQRDVKPGIVASENRSAADAYPKQKQMHAYHICQSNIQEQGFFF